MAAEIDVVLAEAPAVPRLVVTPALVAAALAEEYSRPSAERLGIAPRLATAGGRGGSGALVTSRETPEPPNDRDGRMTPSEYEIAEFSEEDGAAIWLRVCLRTGYDARHMDTNLNLRAVRGLLPEEDEDA